MNVVTLVPRRAGIEHRDRLWAFARARWERDFPDWPIHEGHHNDGLFNRSAAINTAAAAAGDWDVAVIIDSDIVCDPTVTRNAVAYAARSGHITLGGSQRIHLTEAGTKAILDGYEGNWRRFVQKINAHETMCCAIVTRDLWDRVGGFDEGFVGYGFEDLAFIVACETMAGTTVVRVRGDVYHLFHHPAEGAQPDHEIWQRNEARFRRYVAAGGNVTAMDRLIAEAHATQT